MHLPHLNKIRITSQNSWSGSPRWRGLHHLRGTHEEPHSTQKGEENSGGGWVAPISRRVKGLPLARSAQIELVGSYKEMKAFAHQNSRWCRRWCFGEDQRAAWGWRHCREGEGRRAAWAMIQEGSKGPEHGGQGNNSLGASVLMEESLRMRKAGKQGRYWLEHFIKDLNFCQGCFLQTSISVSRALQLCSQAEWLSLLLHVFHGWRNHNSERGPGK